MTHAIRIHKTGGPEVLSWEEVQLGKPGSIATTFPESGRNLRATKCRSDGQAFTWHASWGSLELDSIMHITRI